MEASHSSETLVEFQRTVRRYIPEDRTLHSFKINSWTYPSKHNIFHISFIIRRKRRQREADVLASNDRVKSLPLVPHIMEAAGSYLRPCYLVAFPQSLHVNARIASVASFYPCRLQFFIHTSAYHQTWLTPSTGHFSEANRSSLIKQFSVSSLPCSQESATNPCLEPDNYI
jgi:hypothetical protein